MASEQVSSVLVDIRLGREAALSVPLLVSRALTVLDGRGRLTLHTVLPEPLFVPPEVSIELMREHVERDADRWLRSAAAVVPAGVSVSMVAGRGPRAAAIRAADRRTPHDLVLVYGNELAGAWDRRQLARVCQRLRKAGVPVAVVTGAAAAAEPARARWRASFREVPTVPFV